MCLTVHITNKLGVSKLPAAIIYFFAALCGLLVFVVFRIIPAGWLLDYDETEATEDLLTKRRIPALPYVPLLVSACVLTAWLLTGRFADLIICLILFLVCLLLYLIIIADVRTRIIPDQFLLMLAIISVLYWFADGADGWQLLVRFLSGAAAGGLLAILGFIGSHLMKQEAMGMGDVKLLAVLGLLTGFPGIILVFLLSFLLAALPAVILMIARRRDPDRDSSLAFGPYLCLAAILTLIFENDLIGLWLMWLDMAAFV